MNNAEIIYITGNDSERIRTRAAKHDGATSTRDTGIETRAYKGIARRGIARDAQIESAVRAIANRINR